MASKEEELRRTIEKKIAGKAPLSREEVAFWEKGTGKPYAGPKIVEKPDLKKGTAAEWDAWAKYLRESVGPTVGPSGGSAYDRDLKEAEAMLLEKRGIGTPGKAASIAAAPLPSMVAPLPPSTPAPPVPAPFTVPPELSPVVKASGPVPQPKVAPMPSKAGPIQGDAVPTFPGMPIGSTPMVKPPPPVLGAAPTAPGEQAAGESVPEARAFWDYLQKIQGSGDLVAENPMYKKAFDDATPDEKGRLIKENPEYFKKFRAEIGAGLPEAGTKGGPEHGLNQGGKKAGSGGQAISGGEGPATPKALVEATGAGVPDWLMRLGEVLQAGASGYAGNTDMSKTAYGIRTADEAAKAKTETENAFYEKMKALDFEYQSRASATAQDAERALAELQLQAQKEMAEAGRVSDLTLAKLAEANANYRAKLQLDASKAAAAGAPGDWRSALFGMVKEGE
jgi:hypothetical protein